MLKNSFMEKFNAFTWSCLIVTLLIWSGSLIAKLILYVIGCFK